MLKNEVDKVLHTQLIVARMGEKELMNWWNTDIAYKLGGADFLNRLLGKTLAPLSAGEGILKAAQLKDAQMAENIPNNNQVFSLFRPEPKVSTAIEERLRHFKRYPEDLPAEIAQILNPDTDWSVEELAALIPTDDAVKTKGTSFGKEIEKSVGAGIVETMSNLAGVLKSNEKGSYVLSYYVGAAV